jgi:hypothetical protein
MPTPEAARAAAGRLEVHRPRAALPPRQHVQTHVRRDAVQPRPELRAALESVERTPRADHRLLHGILGLEGGAEHPVAVPGELRPVLLELTLEIGPVRRRWRRGDQDRCGIGHRPDPTRRTASSSRGSWPGFRSARNGSHPSARKSPRRKRADPPAMHSTSTVPRSTRTSAPRQSAAEVARSVPGSSRTRHRTKPGGSSSAASTERVDRRAATIQAGGTSFRRKTLRGSRQPSRRSVRWISGASAPWVTSCPRLCDASILTALPPETHRCPLCLTAQRARRRE